MNDRIPLDHLTSDQYDELCDQLDALRQVARGYCPACGRGDAAPTVEDWERERQRAGRAEAKLTAVTDLIAGHEGDEWAAHPATTQLRAILNGEQPAVPDGTDTTEPATAGLRNQIARALEREDALKWGYDHGFADTYGADPETDGFVAAVLATVAEHLEIGEGQAWCKYCRRAWDSPAHRCESDAEQRVQRIAELRDRWLMAGAPPLGTSINRWWDRRLVELNAVLNEEPPGPA